MKTHVQTPIESILEYARNAWRHRRSAIISAWVAFVVLVIAACLVPSQYESRAQVRINSSSVLEPLLQGVAVATDSDKQADLVRRGLLSRPNLEKVARASGIIRDTSTPAMLDGAIANLEKKIKIDGSAQSRVYSITYLDTSPKAARDVVAELLNTFVHESVDAKASDSQDAAAFFDQQVKEYAAKLSESERRLAEFKKQNIGFMPDDRGDYFLRLQQSMESLEKDKSELAVARRQRDALRSKITEGGSSSKPGVMPTPDQIQAAMAIDSEIAQNKRDLDALLLKFTDRYPQVVALRETIGRLESRRAAIGGGVRATGGSVSTRDTANGGAAVISSLEMALNTADVQVAALEARVEDSSRRVGALRAMASSRPEVEAELTKLNRDYGVTKDRYDALLQRLESAKTSNRVDEKSKKTIEVLERPVIATQAATHPKALMILIALLVALIVGVLVAGTRAELTPVYTTRRSLEEAFGLPVLGVVSRSLSDDTLAQERRELTFELSALAGLAGLALLIAIQVAPISAFVTSLMEKGV